MANTLASLLIKLGIDSTEFTKGIDEAKGKISGFGGQVTGAVASAMPAILKTSQVVTAVGTAAIGAGTAVYGMAVKGASAADDLLVMASKTGIGVEKLQEMQYASELVDVSMETMTGSFTRMTMSMAAAKDGTGEQAKIFKQLGVSVTDSAGNLRATNDVWLDSIAALGGVQNQAERDAMSLKLFGRSAIELNPLILAGKDALQKYGQEAQNTGYILKESQVNALASVDDAIQRVSRGAEGIQKQLAASFAPGVASVVETVSGYVGQLGSILGDSSLSTSEKIGKAADLVKTIASDISNALPQLMETGLGIIKALVKGIIGAIPTLMPAIVDVVIGITDFLIEMLPVLADGAIQIIVALANGIGAALPKLIPAVVEAMLIIVNVLIENIPLLISAALQLIIGLAKGLILAIPQLIAAVPKIIVAIFNGLVSGVGQLVNAGGQLMAGFWQGVQSWFGRIGQGIADFIGGVVSSVKGALGIHSPSSVFASIGSQSIAGLALGLSDLSPIKAAMNNVSGAMTASYSASGAIAQQPAAGGAKNVSFVINNPVGETTYESMKRGLNRLQWLGVA